MKFVVASETYDPVETEINVWTRHEIKTLSDPNLKVSTDVDEVSDMEVLPRAHELLFVAVANVVTEIVV